MQSQGHLHEKKIDHLCRQLSRVYEGIVVRGIDYTWNLEIALKGQDRARKSQRYVTANV